MGNKKDQKIFEQINTLKKDLASLRTVVDEEGVSQIARNKINVEIQAIRDSIEKMLCDIDPIVQPTAVFDPGDPDLVGRFIALAMVAQKRLPLMDLEKFYGAGVYAIYYRGGFKAYRPISGTEVPIYVGKAEPIDSKARTPLEQGVKLAARLIEHRKNIIKAAATLCVDDFDCRYLVVQSGWEKSAETYLINFFRPVWNNETAICYGLGKHGDSAETRSNKRSPWDILHPGRGWADAPTLKESMPRENIISNIEKHFQKAKATHKLYGNITDVLNDFINGLRF